MRELPKVPDGLGFELMYHGMANKVLPFPRPHGPSLEISLLVLRRSAIITVGTQRYVVDMTAEVRPLSNGPASVKRLDQTVQLERQSRESKVMSRQTKFLHLREEVAVGISIDGWRVCWLGGWDRGRLFFVVMVERRSRSRFSQRCPPRGGVIVTYR